MKNRFGKLALSTALALTVIGFGPLKTPQAFALDNNDIVVSIRPLHSLVANITKGVSTPKLLVTGASSPHTYALKPSDAKALSQAKAIFWIGPDLEGFMQKPLESLPHNAKVVSFLPEPKPGAEHEEDHKKEANHKDDDDHNEKHQEEDADGHHHHGGIDPHIWLNPEDAKEIAEKTAATLSAIDPANASKYQANLKQTLDKLSQLDQALSAKLKGTGPLFVFHNAYGHMAERYKLNIVASLVHNPGQSPGAKQIAKIRGQIKASKVACVFSEPQFNPKIVKAVTTNTKAKTATLDPLGSSLKTGPDLYFNMMQQLADHMAKCR